MDNASTTPKPTFFTGSATTVPSPATTALGVVYVLENDRISSVITELIVKKNLAAGQVRCFPNGQLAFIDLAVALQTGVGIPDLILLDLDMPLMDGWEFLEALGRLPAAHGVAVCVLTSSIHPDDVARATGYRVVNGFFTKPLNEDSIVRLQGLLQGVGLPAGHAVPDPVAATLTAAGYAQLPARSSADSGRAVRE